MTSRLTDIDTALISAMTFQFPKGRASDSGVSESGAYTGSGYNVKFQFPPKIVSDGRKGDWVEGQLRGDEPVAVFATSGPREVTLRWTYIAGSMGGSPPRVFSPYFISRQVSGLRAYFSNAYHQGITIDQTLVVRFRMWFHGGSSIMTCRIKSFDVTHGTTLITDYTEDRMGNVERGYVPSRGSISPRRTYPLRTDITAELRLWTKVGATGEEEAAAPRAGEDGEQIKVDLNHLAPKIPVDWQ